MYTLGTVPVFENNMNEAASQLRSRYELHENRMEVYDIVWGDEVFDHPVFVELAQHDALRRLQTVEQLTLPDRYKTIPGSTQFSRWEHAWGSAIFAKRMALEAGHDENTADEYALSALLSDVCHTAHSHAGDWIVQGVGRHETLHDERRLAYAEAIGLNEILRRYGFNEQKILADGEDGILDRRMPDLDIDRIDYTLRESYRWVAQIPEYRQLLNKDSFTIRNGQIVCVDRIAAKLFGVSYVLLATEHWQEPAHRLQLELFMESMKRVFVARQARQEDVGTYSPLDFLMVTDDTLQREANKHDEYLPMLHELMRGVSDAEVNGRWRARADRVKVALGTGIEDPGKPVEWLTARYDSLPRAYEIDEADSSKLRTGPYTTVLHLNRLRKRTVDPLFIDESGTVKRLSEEDESFREYEEIASARVQKNWRAGIIGNRVATAALKECLRLNEEAWPNVMERPRMPNAVLRELLRETVRTSNGAAADTIEFTIHS